MSAPNPLRGEAVIGEQRVVVNFNALCSLEAELNKTVPEFLVMLNKGLGFRELRTCIRVFADKDMTEEEAGDLIERETYPVALNALSVAIGGFFSPKKEAGARPRKAA